MAEHEHSPLAVDNDFGNLTILKEVCRDWAIKKTFEFKTVRATKTRYEIVCKQEGCSWRLYARSIGEADNIFRIIKYNGDHECFGLMHTGHKQATAKFIASWILPKLKQQPDHRPSAMVIDFKTEFGIDIEYSKALRGKERAIEMIHGTFEDAYKAMPQYCRDIEATNPGSIASLELTSDNRFKRVFISFGASAMGFAHCRPLIGLDGTHLKTRYQGILLGATAVDALGQLFPLAYAVVSAENNENWLWMLQHLHRVIETYASDFLENKVHISSD